MKNEIIVNGHKWVKNKSESSEFIIIYNSKWINIRDNVDLIIIYYPSGYYFSLYCFNGNKKNSYSFITIDSDDVDSICSVAIEKKVNELSEEEKIFYIADWLCDKFCTWNDDMT